MDPRNDAIHDVSMTTGHVPISAAFRLLWLQLPASVPQPGPGLDEGRDVLHTATVANRHATGVSGR